MVKKVKIKASLSAFIIIITSIFSSIYINAAEKSVIIGGEAFGLKLYCKGVLVTRLESCEGKDGETCPAKDAGLKSNDIITKVNGVTVKTNDELSREINKSKGKETELEIIRNDCYKTVTIKPEKSSDERYYTGIWVRDSCAGIGTISYYDPENMTYGALGHGICDIDTGSIMESDNGEIVSADITSGTKSENNNIGTLNGYFSGTGIGRLTENTPIGVYGSLSIIPEKSEVYPVASKEEVKTGKAELYTTVYGSKPKKYEIEITQINNDYKNSNKSLIIKITDEELLNAAGGIVQGMSGSPIIQNGKFAGALTHVFLDDCQSGYAILAENLVKG